MSKIIKDTHRMPQSMDMVLSECLNASNDLTRDGCIAFAQWVLSRFSRSPPTLGDEGECLDVSAWQAHAYGPTICGIQSREALQWDCDERVRRATLRKAALWLDNINLETSLHVGENHELVNTDCNVLSDQD